MEYLMDIYGKYLVDSSTKFLIHEPTPVPAPPSPFTQEWALTDENETPVVDEEYVENNPNE